MRVNRKTRLQFIFFCAIIAYDIETCLKELIYGDF